MRKSRIQKIERRTEMLLDSIYYDHSGAAYENLQREAEVGDYLAYSIAETLTVWDLKVERLLSQSLS